MRLALTTLALTVLIATPASASHRVTLASEQEEYTYLVMLEPTASMTWNLQCGTVPGEKQFRKVRAYKWNGKALGRQRINSHGVLFWRDPEDGGRAKWDGHTMVNRTTRNVLFAVWC